MAPMIGIDFGGTSTDALAAHGTGTERLRTGTRHRVHGTTSTLNAPVTRLGPAVSGPGPCRS